MCVNKTLQSYGEEEKRNELFITFNDLENVYNQVVQQLRVGTAAA